MWKEWHFVKTPDSCYMPAIPTMILNRIACLKLKIQTQITDVILWNMTKCFEEMSILSTSGVRMRAWNFPQEVYMTSSTPNSIRILSNITYQGVKYEKWKWYKAGQLIRPQICSTIFDRIFCIIKAYCCCWHIRRRN